MVTIGEHAEAAHQLSALLRCISNLADVLLERRRVGSEFYFRTTDITGTIELPEGTEMCMPGDNTKMTVELINPIAMDDGLRFAIREGGRTVGAGAVTKILE